MRAIVTPYGVRALVVAGMVLGAGMGGFADGIVFHQILQWHNMFSARIPPDNLVGVKANMLWDGIFHAAMWVTTLAGLGLLFKAARRPDVAWSGQAFIGALLLGWGLFNLVEGLIDHQMLGLHHVMEYAADKLVADLAFLGFGLALVLLGIGLIRRRAR